MTEKANATADAAKEEAMEMAPPPTTLAEVQEVLFNTVKNMFLQFIEHLPLMGIGIIVLIATWGVSKLITRIISTLLHKRDTRRSLIDLITRLASIGIWILGTLVAAMVVFPELTISKTLGALGLFSLAIGFAFKDIFENFFAGVLMLWKFPFENGDFIECESISGKILNITVRQTLIERTSGVLVVVPNGYLFKNPVEVLTYKPRRREILMTGVAYGEDVETAVGVIQKALESCESIDHDHPVQVFPNGFGDSSIDIEVAWWTGSKPVDLRSSRGEVVTAIKKALDTAGIEIPFPYRTLTFKENLKITKMDKPANDEDAA